MHKKLPQLAKMTIVILLSVIPTLLMKAALADEECRDPISEWQPREVLKKRLEEQGWVVHRIRIDDGCYQVRAVDAQGRRVEATYSPATLDLLEFEVEDEDHERREHRNGRD